MVETRGVRVALAGFPFHRRSVRTRFPQLLAETGWRRKDADLRLLCMHHCVEGATVGISHHTFRHAPDVIRCSDLPRDFAAVLSGHIHRHQVLSRDLQGRRLPTPVLYPGSVERTAFAEMEEEKGYLLLEGTQADRGGRLIRHDFVRLPARPMILRDLHTRTGSSVGWTREALHKNLVTALGLEPPDAVLRVRIHGSVPPEARDIVAAHHLRRISPPEMNLEVLLEEDRAARRVGRPGRRSRSAIGTSQVNEPSLPPEQLEMPLPVN